MINKKDIFNALKSIKYPGFSRDIVSFGMIHDVIVDVNSISILLNQKTNDEQIINQIISDIKTNVVLKDYKINISSKPLENNQISTNKSVDKIKNIIAVASGRRW